MAGVGAGNTASLAFGGQDAPGANSGTTENWNGTAWTELADLNTARQAMASSGINTAALAVGGVVYPPAAAVSALNETWNGTSWTEIADLNTARSYVGGSGSGTTTAALVFGGNTPPITVNTELWNGTAWAEQNNLSTARQDLSGAGTSTAALAFGGSAPSDSAATEEWTAPTTATVTFTVS